MLFIITTKAGPPEFQKEFKKLKFKLTLIKIKIKINFIGHKRASSGFFFQKNPPKPKKGPNLFFEVEIVSLA